MKQNDIQTEFDKWFALEEKRLPPMIKTNFMMFQAFRAFANHAYFEAYIACSKKIEKILKK